MEKAYSVALVDTENNRHYSARVRINDTTDDHLVIDSGASKTAISSRAASELRLISLGVSSSETAYGLAHDHIAVVDRLTLGNFSASTTTLLYSGQEGEQRSSLLASLLGLDFLTQYRVLMDFPAKQMYLVPAERKSVTVPFSKNTIYSMPFFDVRLTDGKVHMLGLSTNARSVLDKSLTVGWPAVPVELDPSFKAGSRILTSKMDLPTGKLPFGNTDFKMADLHDLKQSLPLLDGIIGEDLLSQCAVRLNFSRKQMTFITPGNVAGTPFVAINAIRIPLVLTDQGYSVRMLVDGKPATFVLSLLHNDTTLNSKALVDSLKPKAVETYIRKDTRARELLLHSLSVGDKQWTEPVVDDDSSSTGSEPNWLGTDFLHRFLATIDFAGQALYLETDKDYKPDLTDNISVGIRPTLTSDGRIFVAQLSDPSSAKEANVQIDDEILEMNGKLVSKTSMDDISAEFKKPVGTVVTVLIQHKGDPKPRTVKLKIRKTL